MSLRNSNNWAQMTSDEIHSLEAIVEIREHQDFPEQLAQKSIDEFINKLQIGEPLRYKVLYNTLRYAGDSIIKMEEIGKNEINKHLPKNKYLKIASVLILFPALATVSFALKLSSKYLQKIPAIISSTVSVAGFLGTGYLLSSYAYHNMSSTVAKAISLYYQISLYSFAGALCYAGIKGNKLLSDSYYVNLRERAVILETAANYQLRNFFARKFEVDAIAKFETDSDNKELQNDIIYFKALQKSE